MPSNTDEPAAAGAPNPAGPSPAYETRDANTKGVLTFLVALFVVINVVLLGTWRLFRHFEVAEQPPAPASSFANARQVPPAPNLQVYGHEDFQKFYAEQQQELDAYAWEDRKAGTVRIPIDRAMDLLLQKGLPILPQGAAGQAAAKNIARPDGGADSNQPRAALEQSATGGQQ